MGSAGSACHQPGYDVEAQSLLDFDLEGPLSCLRGERAALSSPPSRPTLSDVLSERAGFSRRRERRTDCPRTGSGPASRSDLAGGAPPSPRWAYAATNVHPHRFQTRPPVHPQRAPAERENPPPSSISLIGELFLHSFCMRLRAALRIANPLEPGTRPHRPVDDSTPSLRCGIHPPTHPGHPARVRAPPIAYPCHLDPPVPLLRPLFSAACMPPDAE